jgi:hypothetical protein
MQKQPNRDETGGLILISDAESALYAGRISTPDRDMTSDYVM